MASPNWFTETSRDVQELLRKEKRDDLARQVERMAEKLEKQHDTVTAVAVLTKEVEGLSYLVKGVVIVCALEIVAGAMVFLLTRGHGA